MSCEKGPNRVAQLAGQVGAGIAQLASKRSFYAGVAVGAGGTVGSMALIKAIRTRRNGAQTGGRQPVPAGPAPGLRANPQKIPKEALQRPGTRANPKKIPMDKASNAPGTRANPKQIPVLSRTPAETKLKAEPIRIQTGSGQPFTPKNSYRVVRPDGTDTGLAVTPYVREGENGQLVEDDQNWGVTHASSGSLISGPYRSVSQAQGLATQLSGLRWTAARVPAEDVNQAKQIISAYRRSSQSQGEASELRTGSEQDR
ncbi:MAG: hypothetical protein HS126_37095 [Anaerolineales bacterium]|nr:hypothetical protein [Anaerolineales bacterium]